VTFPNIHISYPGLVHSKTHTPQVYYLYVVYYVVCTETITLHGRRTKEMIRVGNEAIFILGDSITLRGTICYM
jgi:hypothetical protein